LCCCYVSTCNAIGVQRLTFFFFLFNKELGMEVSTFSTETKLFLCRDKYQHQKTKKLRLLILSTQSTPLPTKSWSRSRSQLVSIPPYLKELTLEWQFKDLTFFDFLPQPLKVPTTLFVFYFVCLKQKTGWASLSELGYSKSSFSFRKRN
jgi:hypothetical protein